MRILVVNAHSKTPGGQKAFQDLLVCIKDFLKTHNDLLEIKDDYIIREKNNIDDFLYDEYSSFSSPNGGKEFDTLDMIIVSGDLHLLPWSPSNYKVLTLLRMCIRVKKCLFAIGFAMQALIYLSASNMNSPINVINGEGKGGKLGDIANLNLKPNEISAQDYFLDNVTGDLYHFQHEAKEWAPVCNIGMHHKKTAEEVNTIGKFVIKTPIYRPKKSIHNNGHLAILDEMVETKCYVKKFCLKHWLFNKCQMEFVVPYRGGRWEAHSFNFTSKDKAFDILADSENGSLVIEYPRIVGVKFLVTKRYPETCHVFHNFVAKYATDIIAKGQSQDISILSFSATQNFKNKEFVFKPDRSNLNSSTNGLDIPKTSQGFRPRALGTKFGLKNEHEHEHDHNNGQSEISVFKHSGFASKMKGKFILGQNAISSHKVNYESPAYSPFMSLTLNHNPSVISNGLRNSGLSNRNDAGGQSPTSDPNKNQDVIKKKSIMRNVRLGSPPDRLMKSMRGLYEDDEQIGTVTKADARRFLYPDLSELEDRNDRRVWVPGSMSKSPDREHVKSLKSVRIDASSPDYQKKGAVPRLGVLDREQKSLQSMEPYVTQLDLRRSYQKAQDDKILSHKKFILSKGPMSFSSTAYTSPTNLEFSKFSMTYSKMQMQEW